jgi:hypothetical protein
MKNAVQTYGHRRKADLTIPLLLFSKCGKWAKIVTKELYLLRYNAV